MCSANHRHDSVPRQRSRTGDLRRRHLRGQGGAGVARRRCTGRWYCLPEHARGRCERLWHSSGKRQPDRYPRDLSQQRARHIGGGGYKRRDQDRPDDVLRTGALRPGIILRAQHPYWRIWIADHHQQPVRTRQRRALCQKPRGAGCHPRQRLRR